jgi:outer membrane protein assembly factor BamA
LLISGLSLQFSQAQDKEESGDKKPTLSNLDSKRRAKREFGHSQFTPFMVPSYAPELEFLISAGGLYSFKSQKKDPLLERSSLPFSVGYSSNGSIQVSAKLTFYGKQDKTRAIGEFWLKDMPDNYWGVGYENGRHREISDSTTAYHRQWWKLYYKLVRRLRKHVYAGPILDINKTKATDLNPLMEEDPEVMEFGTDIRNSGLGFAIQYDSRDLIVNAYDGWYLDLSTIFYGKFLGGDQRYQSIELDYRQYKNLGKERRTLAWQVKSRITFGEVPWSELSQLGTPFDLRGYRWGRFRDGDMLFGLLEYRHMFNRKRPNKNGALKSRSGFAAWIGTGSVGTEIGELNWLPNYGVGYRFETQLRMNVRVDYGFGVDSNAIYVTFNEAF